MSELDYDDPEVEEQWCAAQQKAVADYLHSQHVEHGQIGDWPGWHLAPHVSIWAIESLDRPEWIGWWVICGDLPTDYIASTKVKPPQHPRKAMRVFAENWLVIVGAWKAGKESGSTRIGKPDLHGELGPLLESRANLLLEWADDDSFWELE